MKCDFCPIEANRILFVGNGKYACRDCVRVPIRGNFLVSNMVTFYDSDGRPIKATQARIDMIKRRYLCPEDGVTVLEMDALGRRRGRKAINY